MALISSQDIRPRSFHYLGESPFLVERRFGGSGQWNDIGGHDIPSGPGAFRESRDVVVTCADGIEAQKPFQN